MKKLISILTLILMTIFSTSALAADASTCILLKFSNDTRFRNIDSASVLSDLVVEKMLNSGRFNLSETKAIDENIIAMLYDEKTREILSVQSEINRGNFTPLFEGPAFDESKVQTIATAQVGQTISSSITSKIGSQHNAQYLIQGTIINIGQGDWLNRDVENFAQAANILRSASAVAGLPVMGGLLSSASVKEVSIGVQTDLRIIEAATGKVIWRKVVTGLSKKTQEKIGGLTSGSAKLDSNMYGEAMEDAAQKIVESMMKDLTLYMIYNR